MVVNTTSDAAAPTPSSHSQSDVTGDVTVRPRMAISLPTPDVSSYQDEFAHGVAFGVTDTIDDPMCVPVIGSASLATCVPS